MNGNGSVVMIEEIVERVLGTGIEGESLSWPSVGGWLFTFIMRSSVISYRLVVGCGE